jgi:hypothetical protein
MLWSLVPSGSVRPLHVERGTPRGTMFFGLSVAPWRGTRNEHVSVKNGLRLSLTRGSAPITFSLIEASELGRTRAAQDVGESNRSRREQGSPRRTDLSAVLRSSTFHNRSNQGPGRGAALATDDPIFPPPSTPRRRACGSKQGTS